MRRILFSLLLVLPACSVTPTEYSRDGFYLGGALIGSAADVDDGVNEDDVRAGASIKGGYHFADRFAIEGNFEWVDPYDFDIDEFKMWDLLLQGKFFPLTGPLQPYALGGVGVMSGRSDVFGGDSSELIYRLGAGLELYLLEFLPIYTEVNYTMPSGDFRDLEIWGAQIGVQLRF